MRRSLLISREDDEEEEVAGTALLSRCSIAIFMSTDERVNVHFNVLIGLGQY